MSAVHRLTQGKAPTTCRTRIRHFGVPMRTITPVVLSLSLLTGCAKHSATYEQSAATGTAEQSKTLHSEGLALWEERDDAAKLGGGARQVRGGVQRRPNQP